MDGYEFLVAAKKSPETQHIPVIVVTAIGQEEEVSKATAMGADAYLTKPFSSSNLIETIQNQLEKQKVTTTGNDLQGRVRDLLREPLLELGWREAIIRR